MLYLFWSAHFCLLLICIPRCLIQHHIRGTANPVLFLWWCRVLYSSLQHKTSGNAQGDHSGYLATYNINNIQLGIATTKHLYYIGGSEKGKWTVQIILFVLCCSFLIVVVPDLLSSKSNYLGSLRQLDSLAGHWRVVYYLRSYKSMYW